MLSRVWLHDLIFLSINHSMTGNTHQGTHCLTHLVEPFPEVPLSKFPSRQPWHTRWYLLSGSINFPLPQNFRVPQTSVSIYLNTRSGPPESGTAMTRYLLSHSPPPHTHTALPYLSPMAHKGMGRYLPHLEWLVWAAQLTGHQQCWVPHATSWTYYPPPCTWWGPWNGLQGLHRWKASPPEALWGVSYSSSHCCSPLIPVTHDHSSLLNKHFLYVLNFLHTVHPSHLWPDSAPYTLTPSPTAFFNILS